jgi:flagellar protein FliS
MMFTNPYQAYEQGSVMTSQSPVQLIIALYEGGISAAQEAKRCLETRDIMGRANAITKAMNIVSELQYSLKRDESETQEMSGNLSQLYTYMQQRLLEANLKQVAEPLAEVEGLLRTMVEAWYGVAEKERGAAAQAEMMDYTEPEVTADEDDVLRITYGGYYREPVESFSAVAFSF